MEGLWFTNFNVGPEYSKGLVVLRDGQILGGDHGHTYTGTYSSDGPHLHARVCVTPYLWTPTPAPQPQHHSVMLTFSGTLDGDSATVSGHPDNREDVNVSVELRRAA
jgi:T3SS negative regulator,GrlR